MNSYSILKGCSSSPLVMNIPHSSTNIPVDERNLLLPSDPALIEFIESATDWHTKELFESALLHGGSAIVAEVSRLVLDIERYEVDEQEPQAAKGLGVIYTRTYKGEPLRGEISPEERSRLLKTYYYPYHAALDDLVDSSLSEFNTCFLMDCHSFSMTQPHEIEGAAAVPDICIGTAGVHTSSEMVESLTQVAQEAGVTVACDYPYQGCLVPLKHFGNSRVQAAMIELNKRVYLDEKFQLIPEKAGVLQTCIRQMAEAAVEVLS